MIKDALCFESPVVGGDERPINGNLPENRRSMRHIIAIDDWYGNRIVQLRYSCYLNVWTLVSKSNELGFFPDLKMDSPI